MKFLVPILIAVVLFVTSCDYNNKEDMFPISETCDTMNVSYSETIVPIITTYCLGCHSNTSAPLIGDNNRLEDYSDLKDYIENGSFWGSLNGEPAYEQMPFNGSKLDDCTLLKVKSWIDKGYPEN